MNRAHYPNLLAAAIRVALYGTPWAGYPEVGED
jgi:hypothetical protein